MLIYYLIRYRRKVTATNLLHAFPDKSDKERKAIERSYYHHLCDLLTEGIFNLICSRGQIVRRYKFLNPEVVHQFYNQHKSVILLSAHYNNWEYMITSIGFRFYHNGVGVGKPLSNQHIAAYITQRRSRFGTEIVDQHNVRQVFQYYHDHNIPTAYLMLADQSVNDVNKCVWTTFLNQETPFIYGPEYFARKYDIPVVYYEVHKTRRHQYEISFEVLCDQPSLTPQYSITKQYIGRLDKLLRQRPDYWLWTHKRWKRQRPEGMQLMTFNDK
ncbi:MAG: lysophospholipid acyltransferase family protein [Bacteroidales bacterium]|nr:lysophospholipid acyltransferase family protein [Candidatus Colimorpha onthohippi]